MDNRTAPRTKQQSVQLLQQLIRQAIEQAGVDSNPLFQYGAGSAGGADIGGPLGQYADLAPARIRNNMNRSFLFADPGDYYKQTVPPVEIPQFPGDAPTVEPLMNAKGQEMNLGYNPQQVLNTILQGMAERKRREIRLNQIKGIQHLLQTTMGNQPLVSGQLGRMKFGAGPFVGSSGGRPNVGVGVRGGFSF